MTAFPDPTTLAKPAAPASASGLSLHPSVKEDFWGYELRMNERWLTGAAVMRALSGIAAVVSTIAALGVWLLPEVLVTEALGGSPVFVSVLLALCTLVFLAIWRRGTVIRVQVDTRVGELREVVDLKFGSVEVLARHGFDAVTSVAVVQSKLNATVGQIHVQFADRQTIAVADGAPSSLRPLRDRLLQDLGLVSPHRREAEWSGPLQA